MKDGKKVILIILVAVCVLITILVLFLNGRSNDPSNMGTGNNNSSNVDNNGNNNNNGNNTNNGNSENNGQNNNNANNNGGGSNTSGSQGGTNNSASFYKVSNYSEFYSVQTAINNATEVNESYIAKEMYVKKSENNNYYFVNGCLLVNDVGEESVDYTKSVIYLLVLDKNSQKFELTKLVQKISNLESYAKEFKATNKNITSGNKFKTTNLSTEKLITTYIEYFKYMLVLDTKVAYNMLYTTTKENYVDYYDFYNQVPTIYNKLTSKLFSFSTMQVDGKNKYAVEDNNRNRIVIYEDGVMNFKISYNIL